MANPNIAAMRQRSIDLAPYRRPRKLAAVGCTPKCTLNADGLPGYLSTTLHKIFEAGGTIEEVINKAGEAGTVLSAGAVARHRSKHLHEIDESMGATPEKVDTLEVLDAMIARGAQQVKRSDVKVTAEQLLRAMELKLKLTQGSVFDAMYNAMRGDDVDLDAEFAEEEAIRDGPAEMSVDEADQVAFQG